MYSTKSNAIDRRYAVRCLIVSRYVATEHFLVDTGAAYTCCNFTAVDKMLSEVQFSVCDCKYLCGIVNGAAVKFYKYHLQQFTVGNIDMGGQDIWITFDERVTDIILGMDILKKVIMITNPYDQKIYFCKDKDDYDSNFELLTA